MKRLASVSALAAFACLASGQTVIEVQVGDTGSFFDPPTISALEGDTVRFIFAGRNHSVIQSTFENPCLPLSGGFSSGAAGVGANASAPPPIWDLMITNDSAPIWYFCNLVFPSSHCAAGMVGAINPQPGVFGQYLSAARAVSGTPAPSSLPALSGVGALASNTPLPTPTFAVSFSGTLSLSPFSSPTDTSSPAGPAASAAAKISLSNTAVIGGVAGGATLVLVTGILAFLLVRSHRRNQRYNLDRVRNVASHLDMTSGASTPTQQSGTSGADGTEMGHALPQVMPSMADGAYTGLHANQDGRYQQYSAKQFVVLPVTERSTSYSNSMSPRKTAGLPIPRASPDTIHISGEGGNPIESGLRFPPAAWPPSAKKDLTAPSARHQLSAVHDLTSDESKSSLSTSGPPEYALIASA